MRLETFGNSLFPALSTNNITVRKTPCCRLLQERSSLQRRVGSFVFKLDFSNQNFPLKPVNMSVDNLKSNNEKKRKYEDVAGREFNADWTNEFMFVPSRGGKPVCLICGFCVSVTKTFNLERHFTTTHPDINTQYPISSELRKDFIAKKRSYLTSQQSFFTKANEQSNNAVVASYEITLLLARKKKPFTDAEEIIKPSLKIAARMLGDKKCETKFDQIPLSNNKNLVAES